MPGIGVKAEYDCEAQKLWAVLSDFRNMSWVPGADTLDIEFVGDGPGMYRLIDMGGKKIREELYEVHPDELRVVYGITENNPLPVTDYRATMKITELGPKRCGLDWSCTFEPDGITVDQAEAAVTQFYTGLLDSIRNIVC